MRVSLRDIDEKTLLVIDNRAHKKNISRNKYIVQVLDEHAMSVEQEEAENRFSASLEIVLRNVSSLDRKVENIEEILLALHTQFLEKEG